MDVELDSKYIDGNIPEACKYVQAMLDRLVAVNYDATYQALHLHSNLNNLDYLREQLIPILRDNPPLATIPKYLCDGRPNYLWYSDFYDDAGKEVFKQYRAFPCALVNITPANYSEELNKIELPYFAAIVKLVALEKLYIEAERRITAANEKIKEQERSAETDNADTPEEPQKEKPLKKGMTAKRSYEPKMNNKQFELLAECIEEIKLFRQPLTVDELKRLLKGKLRKPLQVTNQNSLTFLLDKLADNGYIRNKWISLAAGNKDFLSFRRGKNVERYGDEPHYIPMGQFSNCHTNNEKVGFKDRPTIEDFIEEIKNCRDD